MFKKIAKFIAAWIFLLVIISAMLVSETFMAILIVALVIGATSFAIWTIVNE